MQIHYKGIWAINGKSSLRMGRAQGIYHGLCLHWLTLTDLLTLWMIGDTCCFPFMVQCVSRWGGSGTSLNWDQCSALWTSLDNCLVKNDLGLWALGIYRVLFSCGKFYISQTGCTVQERNCGTITVQQVKSAQQIRFAKHCIVMVNNFRQSLIPSLEQRVSGWGWFGKIYPSVWSPLLWIVIPVSIAMLAGVGVTRCNWVCLGLIRGASGDLQQLTLS